MPYMIAVSLEMSDEPKIKGFRAQLHGIADIPFFLYRVCTIFG